MALPRWLRLFVVVCVAVSPLLLTGVGAADTLEVTRADRKIDLSSNVVRVVTTFKVENVGDQPVARVLMALPLEQGQHVSYASLAALEGKAKNRKYTQLDVGPAEAQDYQSSNVLLFSATLPKPLAKGETALLESYVVLLDVLTPLPVEITQAETQRVVFLDSHYLLSPYPVRAQSTAVRLPSANVESFTPLEPSRKVDTDLKFGPYENVKALEVSPLRVHYENNRPFAVARTLVREIEVSHWGNVYFTEDYDVVHDGAKHKGVFSRLDLQARPHAIGVSSLRGMLASLPPRVRAVYFRDEIGNISTTHLRINEKRRSELELEPRYPVFGGWSTTFRLGYSTPLADVVSLRSDGVRVLNTTFGGPFGDLPVRKLIVKVILPEGAWGIESDLGFPATKTFETKYSYLDTVGRPVVVFEKKDVVAEQSTMYFQVRYHFSPISLLAEPLLLVAAFAVLFLVAAIYVRLDFTISKSSPAYQARLQQEEVTAAVQLLQRSIAKRTATVEKLEASLTSLGRSGNVAAAKAARKDAEASLKESGKDVKAALDKLESQPKPPRVLPTAQALAAKDKERADKALQKHTVAVEAYDKSLPPKEIDARTSPITARLVALKSEMKELLLSIEE